MFIEQERVSTQAASILVRAEIENHGAVPRYVDVKITVLDTSPSGEAVAAATMPPVGW